MLFRSHATSCPDTFICDRPVCSSPNPSQASCDTLPAYPATTAVTPLNTQHCSLSSSSSALGGGTDAMVKDERVCMRETRAGLARVWERGVGGHLEEEKVELSVQWEPSSTSLWRGVRDMFGRTAGFEDVPCFAAEKIDPVRNTHSLASSPFALFCYHHVGLVENCFSRQFVIEHLY